MQASDGFVGLHELGRASLGQAYRWALVVVMSRNLWVSSTSALCLPLVFLSEASVHVQGRRDSDHVP